MKITGKVWRFPQDDINTDAIRRSIYANLPLEEQAKHTLETIDPTFAAKVSRGDIIVAGKNFGAGSSRPAHATFMALGIGGIVAESFGRIFFRNSISGGLLVSPCPGIIDFVATGDVIEVDIADGTVRNTASGKVMTCAPLPSFLRGMVAVGGEKAYLKQRMAQMG